MDAGRAGVAAMLLAWMGEAAAQALAVQIEGPADASAFGHALAVAGDADGDGRLDLLVGAPFDSVDAGPLDGGFQGRVQLRSGADGALLAEADGAGGGELYGWSLAAVGDVDGDGAADFAAGAPNADAFRGRVELVSSASGAVLWTLAGDSAGDRFGWALAALGDLDGDGISELAIGAWGDAQPLAGSGALRIVSGASGGFMFSVSGAHAFDHLGSAVVATGDLDLDGWPDVAVSAELLDANGKEDVGGVLAVSGETGLALWTTPGTTSEVQFGHALAGPGDTDGDGTPDVVVGFPLADAGGTDSGGARVLSGSSGALLLELAPPAPFGQGGAALAGAGDVDGDGRTDIALGSPLAGDPPLQGPGRVSVHSGVGGGLLRSFSGSQALGGFGGALSGGDVDGDGWIDLLVGAPWEGGTPVGPGRVSLYSGDAWLDVGQALAGGAGVPLIQAQGTASVGQDVGLSLAGASPGAPCLLLIGTQALLAPFKGGTLVPDPLWSSPPLVTEATGGVALAGTWPPGAPVGTAFLFQWWISDVAAPQGWAASAGLKVTVQ